MDVDLLVEGFTDEVFVRHCYARLGIGIGAVYGKRGISYVKEKARAFSARGEYAPILILADFMDVGASCPSEACRILVPDPQGKVLVRLAVREVESWLLASRSELARYFGVSISQVPPNPDAVADPKQALINIARRSPRAKLKQMFVPKEGVSSSVGVGYVDGFTDFVRLHWSLEAAAESSPSFSKFIHRSRDLFLRGKGAE